MSEEKILVAGDFVITAVFSGSFTCRIHRRPFRYLENACGKRDVMSTKHCLELK